MVEECIVVKSDSKTFPGIIVYEDGETPEDVWEEE